MSCQIKAAYIHLFFLPSEKTAKGQEQKTQHRFYKALYQAVVYQFSYDLLSIVMLQKLLPGGGVIIQIRCAQMISRSEAIKSTAVDFFMSGLLF